MVGGRVPGADPVAFAKSHNLHRRNMTSSQRAAAVVACSVWATVKDNQYAKSAGAATSPAQTVPQMAKDAEVSERTIQQAKAAHVAGLGEAVRDGKITAEQAGGVSTWSG